MLKRRITLDEHRCGCQDLLIACSTRPRRRALTASHDFTAVLRKTGHAPTGENHPQCRLQLQRTVRDDRTRNRRHDAHSGITPGTDLCLPGSTCRLAASEVLVLLHNLELASVRQLHHCHAIANKEALSLSLLSLAKKFDDRLQVCSGRPTSAASAKAATWLREPDEEDPIISPRRPCVLHYLRPLILRVFIKENCCGLQGRCRQEPSSRHAPTEGAQILETAAEKTMAARAQPAARPAGAQLSSLDHQREITPLNASQSANTASLSKANAALDKLESGVEVNEERCN